MQNKTEEELAAEWGAAGNAEGAAASTEPMNQSDVDALFGAGQEVRSKTGIELLLDKALSSQMKLPMLDVVYDRFVRMISNSLRAFTSQNVDISIEKAGSTRFGDYIDSIPIPTMIAVIKAIEWDNFGLVIIDSQLTYSLVEILFGGRKIAPSLKVEGRPFTSIELSMVQSVIEITLEDLAVSFEPVTPVTFQLDRIETNPRFAAISRQEDVALLLSLRVDMDVRKGKIDILFPFSAIEPVKKILSKAFIGERGGKDPAWGRHIESEISNANVTIEAIVNGNTSAFKNVIHMNVGDTIILDRYATDDIILKVNNIRFSSAKLGKKDDKVAIQLTEEIDIKKYNY